MPAMPRMDNKLKKIAYKILGVPANMKQDRSQKDSKIKKRLNFEETSRVR